jgi:hypothetical protein
MSREDKIEILKALPMVAFTLGLLVYGLVEFFIIQPNHPL